MIPALIDFLAAHHQQGDASGLAATAQTLLSAIPDDLVALQFLALALLWMGHKRRALSLFHRAAAIADATDAATASPGCERAATISLREATRPELAGGWHQIASALELNGLHRLARRARRTARRSRAQDASHRPAS